MSLTYTKTRSKPRRNLFVVTFSFEHGDADQRTNHTVDVPLSKEDLVDYLAKVKDIASQIDDARSSGSELPGDFQDTAKYKDVWISVELDCFASRNMSNYYAAMSVESIEYFDENGEHYEVKETR
jgi:hypothetical protein